MGIQSASFLAPLDILLVWNNPGLWISSEILNAKHLGSTWHLTWGASADCSARVRFDCLETTCWLSGAPRNFFQTPTPGDLLILSHSNKSNHCDFTSWDARHLRRHSHWRPPMGFVSNTWGDLLTLISMELPCIFQGDWLHKIFKYTLIHRRAIFLNF